MSLLKHLFVKLVSVHLVLKKRDLNMIKKSKAKSNSFLNISRFYHVLDY